MILCLEFVDDWYQGAENSTQLAFFSYHATSFVVPHALPSTVGASQNPTVDLTELGIDAITFISFQVQYNIHYVHL